VVEHPEGSSNLRILDTVKKRENARLRKIRDGSRFKEQPRILQIVRGEANDTEATALQLPDYF
jgi:hypothetical protein